MRSELQWGAARLCAERHVRPSSRLWKRLSKGSANVTLQRTCKGGLDVNPEVKTGGEKIGYKPWPARSQSGMKPSGS
ncbi:hypothetical protein CDO26_20755 (plasmid) [Sinorhizobium meliloti]|nr:hypothetical protein CDO26_20755 [Sinorhizobium meliloti]ASP95747.1 hypothetical protein CDO25_32740 [Sinorhizobium meliloti]RVG84493.1 hypothetical protein CN219_14655 [Sinorhizobium meliloti]RVI35563.1 hypothetical protein CN197_13440 [Sinorhizobium meliloti]RVI44979.1 hypothetical protein CN196_14170 [Sinorhizobium meliloti]